MVHLSRTEVALPCMVAVLLAAPWVALADLGAWGDGHWADRPSYASAA
jgi:hypothetical protein